MKALGNVGERVADASDPEPPPSPSLAVEEKLGGIIVGVVPDPCKLGLEPAEAFGLAENAGALIKEEEAGGWNCEFCPLPAGVKEGADNMGAGLRRGFD